jgi:PRTRC genetic system protein A
MQLCCKRKEVFIMNTQNTNYVDDFLTEVDNQPSTEVNNQPQEAEFIPPTVPRESAPVPNVIVAGIPPIATSESESEQADETDQNEVPEPEQAESPSESENADENVQESLLDDDDPLAAALKRSEAASKERLIGNLAAKNPVFKHGSVADEITDKELTFEDLRQKYETDFPELEEAQNVSWTVTYGKCSEKITKPSKEKVFEIKAKIEKSEKFITDLKKAKTDKDKNPDCIVKPTVTAQKKGDTLAMSDYKGFFLNYGDAIESQKAICFVPARDGHIYEVRRNPIGIFQSPAKAIGEFPDLTAKFVMELPKIPMFLLQQVISFFRVISQKAKLEVLVHLVYDTKTEKYNVIVPKQKVSNVSVDAETVEYPEHVIHVMDIHSHNVMAAKFSATDDKDEKATRLYGVIGKLNEFMPDLSFRASNGGKFIKLNADEIFDYDSTYPEEWFDNIDHEMAEAICETEKSTA